MPELVVFSGLQASGKTTFYRLRFATTHQLVSKDLWPNARHREARQRRRIVELLTAGQSVVVDNTNPTAEHRAPLVQLATHLNCSTLSYAFSSTVEDSVARNALRALDCRVPNVGIYTVAKKLTLPSSDEGFVRRFVVQISGDGFVVLDASA
jgi:predicted kinase